MKTMRGMRGGRPMRGPREFLAFAILCGFSVVGSFAAAAPAVGPSDAPGGAALIRDVRPTSLDVGDTLVVELDGGSAPTGPAVILLAPLGELAVGAKTPPLVLRGRALGDGRVVASIDEPMRVRFGGERRLADVVVEAALTDTGNGAAWAATGGHRTWRTPPGERYTLTFFPGSLRGLAGRLASEHRVTIAGHALPPALVAGGVSVAVVLVILLLIAPATGLLVVWERKVAGRMQSRFGPNRVGPRGWLQWLADALKLITKEDLMPASADPVLFRLSPYLAWMGVFATLVVLPLSQAAIVADLNVGVLYLGAVTTLTVVGILMGGWASNSKWSVLGGMRAAAQIVSYELPVALALLVVVVLAGTLSPQDIVRAQGPWPVDWFVFRSPITFVAFFVYFIAALAEGNRTPFDLPEAESELVAGYGVEYSGFRWSIFSLAEWTNVFVVAAISSTVFLGGWNVPFVDAGLGAASGGYGIGAQLASAGVMLGKIVVLSFVIIWIRWSLPRLRIDQLMALCWKGLTPLGLGLFVAATAWTWAVAVHPALDTASRWGTFLIGGVGLGLTFALRVVRAFRRTRLLHVGARQFTLPIFERRLEKR